MTRRLRSEKCARCGLPPALCLCGALAPLDTRRAAALPRLVVVLHAKEAVRPSNSGHLLPLLLPATTLVVHGEAEAPVALPALTTPAAVLFPADDARPLDAAAPPATLVVPDGNWRQARRITQRVAPLPALPRLRLPDALCAAPPVARLRGHPEADHLSTLEAVSRAFAALGHPEAAATLEGAWLAFAAAVTRLRAGGV